MVLVKKSETKIRNKEIDSEMKHCSSQKDEKFYSQTKHYCITEILVSVPVAYAKSFRNIELLNCENVP